MGRRGQALGPGVPSSNPSSVITLGLEEGVSVFSSVE